MLRQTRGMFARGVAPDASREQGKPAGARSLIERRKCGGAALPSVLLAPVTLVRPQRQNGLRRENMLSSKSKTALVFILLFAVTLTLAIGSMQYLLHLAMLK